MSEPPKPGTIYRIGRDAEPRYAVRRIIEEHPAYWEVELQGLQPPHALARVLVLRDFISGRAV
ncbi:hypothetical protein [Deinococcus sonorensis]|uniref:Uncharacterized protein n=2 Tax=Deinococcus sonorensis TaxID=309891 RepID=A0AAU7U6F9_9DEIO